MRAAAAHRHAEPLRRADRNVGAPLARRREQRERQDVGRHDERRLPRMDPRGEAAPVVHGAVGRGILHEHPETVGRVERRGDVAHDHLDAERAGPRAEHLDRLRMHPRVDEERGTLARGGAPGERHGLRGGGRLVEQRSVGDRHAGEVADHRLKIDERLHPSLADLGLVGRVGGVPGRVLEDVPQDHARGVGGVVALPDKTLEEAVPSGDRPQFGEGRGLGDRGRQIHGPTPRDARGHDALDQRPAGVLADRVEHVPLVGPVRTDVAGPELGGVLERLKGRRRTRDGMFLGSRGRRRGVEGGHGQGSSCCAAGADPHREPCCPGT